MGLWKRSNISILFDFRSIDFYVEFYRPHVWTNYVIKLFDVAKPQSEATQLLLETATLLDDDYFSNSGESTAFNEPAFHLKGDLNNFLGHFDVTDAPQLQALISFHWNDLRRKSGNLPPRLEIIMAEIEK